MQTCNSSHLLLFKQRICCWLRVKTKQFFNPNDPIASSANLRNCNCKMQSYDWRATKEVEVADLHSNFTHIIIFTCSALSVHVLQNEFNGFYGRKIEMQMQFSTVKHHLKNNGRSGFFAPGYKGFSPLKLPFSFTWRMFTWLTWKRERILMMRMRGWNLWQEILTYKVSFVPRGTTHFLRSPISKI